MQQGIDQGVQEAADAGTLKIDGISVGATQDEPTNFVITPDQFMSTLDAEVVDILETKLTPSMRRALGLILGPEIENILDNIGLQEPQHLVPQSVIAQAFPAQTIEESIMMFDQQLMQQSGVQPAMPQDIPGPPQGGLGGMPEGIPQTNVPPVV
jgi:hypothetical protein